MRWNLRRRGPAAATLLPLFLALSAAAPPLQPAPAEEEKKSAAGPAERDLALIEVFVKDLEKPRNVHTESGLKFSATLIPDALAYRVGREYVAARQAGKSHEEAFREVVKQAKDWKGLSGQAEVRLVLENSGYQLAGGERRIFTVQEKLPGKALSLRTDARKNVSVLLVAAPRNLRSAQVRVKKFWKVSEEGGPRVKVKDPDDDSPPGWEPKLSRPMSALLIEKEPVEMDLLFPPRSLEKVKFLELAVAGLKKYEGPFKKDWIDLNAGRKWEAIPPVALKVELPPEGAKVPAPLQELVNYFKRDK